MNTSRSPASTHPSSRPKYLSERDAWWRFLQLKAIAYRSRAQESEIRRLRERLLRISEAWRFARSTFPD